MAFGQEKNVNPNPAAGEPQKQSAYEMHVMPTKFHQYLSVKSKGSASKFLIVFAIVLFVVVILGIGGYFLYLQMNPLGQNINQADLNLPLTSNQNLDISNENLNLANINGEENLNINANDNLNLSANLNENLNSNANLNSALNENTNAQINGNTNINVPGEVITYTGSPDSDNDKLTDVEEDLFQTEKRTSDTDGDGYLDGDEVINDYNPKMAGSARLETSGLVNKYTNPTFSYEILYPTSWLARPEDQSLRSVIFITSTSEFVRVSVEDNLDKLDLVNWYLKISPDADLNLVEKITTKSSLAGLLSPDKLTYYILDPNTQDKVYVINYNISTLNQINFLSTFQMMVNSFKVNQPTP